MDDRCERDSHASNTTDQAETKVIRVGGSTSALSHLSEEAREAVINGIVREVTAGLADGRLKSRRSKDEAHLQPDVLA